MWFKKYYMEYLNHHNYKWNSRHIMCTSYIAIIESKINVVKIKTAIKRTSRDYLLSKKTDKTST